MFGKVRDLYQELPSERVYVNDFMGWLKAKFLKRYQNEIYTKEAADWGTLLHNYVEYQVRLELG